MFPFLLRWNNCTKSMNRSDSAATAAAFRIWWAVLGVAVLCLLLPTAAWSQQPHQETTATKVVDNKTYTYVEQMPEPPGGGGNAAIVALIHKGVRIPLFHGRFPERSRIVFEFTVTKTGDVHNIRILQSIDGRVDTAVVRAVQALPRFTPGRQHGIPVRVRYTLPIIFHWQ